MIQNVRKKNSLENTTCYPSFREIWIEIALVVAALGLVIFGTTAYFDVGALSALPHASYCAYVAWAGAFLFAGGAVAKHLNRCSINTPDDDQMQRSRSDILNPKGKKDDLENLLSNTDHLKAEPCHSVGERTEQKSHFRWDYIVSMLEHEIKHADSPNNHLGPDDSECSNLFLQCQDPEVAFIPREMKRACSAFNINKQSEMEALIEKLKSAFLVGKKIAFAILDTERHALAVGFSSDGSFVIVDSLYGNSVDPKNVERMLNAAKLKDHTQKDIHFNGRFINTHIQKGGHECLRFATLYCYHMALRKDLTAFEEVNGAFLAGRLRCFEDHKKIAGSSRVQSLKDKTCDYRTFMLSWTYRSFGLTVNAWWQLSLNELSHLQSEFDAEMISCYLTKSCLPKFYSSSDFNLEIVSFPLQRKKVTAKTLDVLNLFANPDLHAPIEDSLFKDHQHYLLVFIKGDHIPHLYPLKREEKVEYSQL